MASDPNEHASGPGHVYGRAGAPITILEYGDLECPYCRAAAPVLRQVVDESDGGVRLVWRHFPLFEVHPHALTAALAAEAAGAHGRFWDFHDLAFADQDHLADPDLRRRAATLGLDPDQFVGPAAEQFAPVIEADYLAGIAAGVRGTPTVFVDGVLLPGAPTLAAVRAAVAAAPTATGAQDAR